jgi:hypothetical protein
MAETIGLVQRLTLLSQTLTCVWIGPTSDNSEILTVSNDGTTIDALFTGNLVQALAAAQTNYREVTATHDDDDSEITALSIEPI